MKQEQVEDYELTEKVVECAFSDLEHKLVARIRKTDAFIPELSLLAIDTKKKVGHILLSKIEINNDNQIVQSLALAPVSVLPSYQNRVMANF